jgi:hypothetical protein
MAVLGRGAAQKHHRQGLHGGGVLSADRLGRGRARRAAVRHGYRSIIDMTASLVELEASDSR